jgi:hypothetical protein
VIFFPDVASAPVPTTRSVIGPSAGAALALVDAATFVVDDAVGAELESVSGGCASSEVELDDFLSQPTIKSAIDVATPTRERDMGRAYYCNAGGHQVRSSQNGSGGALLHESHDGEAAVMDSYPMNACI